MREMKRRRRLSSWHSLCNDNGMRHFPLIIIIVLMASACGKGPTAPLTPPVNRIAVGVLSPPSGSAVVVPESYPYRLPGGVIFPRGSGLISVNVSMSVAQPVTWARLNVYLLTAEPGLGYCGQNLPDSPTWGLLPSGWTASHDVSGFQVFRLPCEVTGIRAMLHTRNNGLLTPPLPSETIAEATIPVRYEIRRP